MTTAVLDRPTQQTSQPKTEALVSSHAGASFFCNQIIDRSFLNLPSPRVLVAGCGSGHEATAICARLDCSVDAVDVEDFVDPVYKEQSPVRFSIGSVCDLEFEDDTFDAIFYHHVIEHVDNPAKSLEELSRVLKPKGWLFVGTPNRHRVLSSIGAHQQSEWDATFANKVADNVRDWSDRLRGRFRNELGAHAGFSREELNWMLSKHFDNRIWLTEQYLRFKYGKSRSARLLPVVTHPWFSWFAAPSIYVLCSHDA